MKMTRPMGLAEALLLTMATAGLATVAAAQTATTAVSFFDLETRVPTSWQRQEPSSTMRLLQMTVPGDGAEPAELVVFFFGAGQGGNVDANLERWRGQFTSADGGAVEPVIERFEVSGMPVTVVELTGTYRRNVAGAPVPALADQTLVAAVIETERGTLFAQLHGASATVATQRAAFDVFLRGLHPAG